MDIWTNVIYKHNTKRGCMALHLNPKSGSVSLYDTPFLRYKVKKRNYSLYISSNPKLSSVSVYEAPFLRYRVDIFLASATDRHFRHRRNDIPFGETKITTFRHFGERQLQTKLAKPKIAFSPFGLVIVIFEKVLQFLNDPILQPYHSKEQWRG